MQIHRLNSNPIIKPNMDDRMGSNVNGPSVIRVPEWVSNPMGKYYLYFAHHEGEYIRMAYSDQLKGPWNVYRPGVMHLRDSGFSDHIASPDVHVIDESREIRMYYHGCDMGQYESQFTRLATSPDGMRFESKSDILGGAYWRLFYWKNYWYTLEMPGTFLRSPDGLSRFEKGPTLFSEDMRHSAVLIRGSTLHVFYSNANACPEQILRVDINLEDDWTSWNTSEPVTVLEPEMDWEGADCSLANSQRGAAHGRVRQVRDPYVFEDGDGTFLLYSVAGESGIGIARLLGI